MNLRAFILPFFLLAFSHSKGQVKTYNPTPIIKDPIIHYYTYNECKVYSYRDNDSTNKYLTKTIKYDSVGREVESLKKEFDVYKRSVNIYNSSNQIVENYFHQIDSNFIENVFFKTVFNYDKKGNLFNQITYSFEKRLKKDVDKGDGHPGGCLI